MQWVSVPNHADLKGLDPALDHRASSASMPKWQFNPHSHRRPQILFFRPARKIYASYRLCSLIGWRKAIDNSFTHFPYGPIVELPPQCAIDGAAHW